MYSSNNTETLAQPFGMPHRLPQSHTGDTLIDRYEAPPSFWKYSDLPNHDEHARLCVGILCAICGLHITTHGFDGFGARWRFDAVVVGDLAREYEYVQANHKYRSNCQEPAVFSATISGRCTISKGCSLALSGTSRYCFAYAADTDALNGGPEGENTVYIPMHRSCFLIALKAPAWDQATSSPLRAVFRVLRHRYQVSWTQVLRRFPPPHDSNFLQDVLWWSRKTCINSIGFRDTEGAERGYFHYECMREEDSVWRNHYLAHDPLNIPGLTSTLLSNLEPRVPRKYAPGSSQFRGRLRRLPNELKLLIFDSVASAQDWPLRCTRLLGPRFWKTLFNNSHPCFAWLWDLDREMVRRTDPHLKMDWELLFRKLSQGPKVADCFGGNSTESDFETFRGVLKTVPPGLEGRRRIWKLLEEMYIGDRSTRWQLWLEDTSSGPKYKDLGDVEEVPVYWGRNGDSLGDEELRAL